MEWKRRLGGVLGGDMGFLPSIISNEAPANVKDVGELA